MDLGLVAFIIIAGISLILGVIVMISHAMQLRDRPGVFIFSVLCIIAFLIFIIWLLAGGGGGPTPNPLNPGGVTPTPLLP